MDEFADVGGSRRTVETVETSISFPKKTALYGIHRQARPVTSNLPTDDRVPEELGSLCRQ